MNRTETIQEALDGVGFWHVLNPFAIPDALFAAIAIGALILFGVCLTLLVEQHEEQRKKDSDAAFIAQAERLGFKKVDESD